MPQKLSVPLLRFMYIFCRERTKRCKVAVCRGGKVNDEAWAVAMKQMEELKLNN